MTSNFKWNYYVRKYAFFHDGKVCNVKFSEGFITDKAPWCTRLSVKSFEGLWQLCQKHSLTIPNNCYDYSDYPNWFYRRKGKYIEFFTSYRKLRTVTPKNYKGTYSLVITDELIEDPSIDELRKCKAYSVINYIAERGDKTLGLAYGLVSPDYS